LFELKLPDIGEGIAEGEILKWLVTEGEKVSEEQPLVEVMTDKVNVQIPSPRGGTVTKILAKEGESVKVGQVILVIDSGDAGGEGHGAAKTGRSEEAGVDESARNTATIGGSTTTTTTAAAAVDAPSSSAPTLTSQQLHAKGQVTGTSEGVEVSSSKPAPAAATGAGALATPATRKLARELGVDIGKLHGSGSMGRITEQDVRNATAAGGATRDAQQLVTTTTASSAATAATATGVAAAVVAASSPGAAMTSPPPVARAGKPDQEHEEERVPVRGLRKIVAERMSKSIHTTAQVTHVDEADMTELVLLREAFKGSAEKRGVKLTFLPLMIKAVIPALKEFPYINSSFDEQAGEIVLKKRYNIGIATDTENGLVVPVIKDADRKDVFEIAAEIQQLAAKARAGQLALDDVHGSTFTITNQGSVGGLFATPIINYPEAAILGTHKIAKRPVVREGRLDIRDVMYLSLSFDHRVLDGAYAARFVNKVISIVQDPKLLLSEIL
jgi:pyruvate/2-oxoglutarate dehydrogenase complex dihydrolipoamide acyltransferase (E2) component